MATTKPVLDLDSVRRSAERHRGEFACISGQAVLDLLDIIDSLKRDVEEASSRRTQPIHKRIVADQAHDSFKIGDFIETFYPGSQAGSSPHLSEGGWPTNDERRTYLALSGRGYVKQLLRGGCILIEYQGGGTNVVHPKACRLVELDDICSRPSKTKGRKSC